MWWNWKLKNEVQTVVRELCYSNRNVQVVAKITALPWLDKQYGPSAVFLAGVSNFDSLKQNTQHKHTLAPKHIFYQLNKWIKIKISLKRE